MSVSMPTRSLLYSPPAGAPPLADDRIDARLNLGSLDPEHAIGLRQWLNVALTHQLCLRDHSEFHPVVSGEVLSLFRYAARAAAHLSLRSRFTSVSAESGDQDSGELLQDLAAGTYRALADDLQLSLYACFPASPGQDRSPSWKRSQGRFLARQLIGCLSVLGFRQILDDLFDFAIADAAMFKGISLPEPTAPTGSPVPSSWTMANADELAVTFGLFFGNEYFTQALAGPASAGNPLAPLGVPALIDQVARAAAKTILPNPAAWNEQERIPQPTTFEPGELAALADELDLQDLIPDPLDVQGKADTLCAALGAAFRSYHGDGQALAGNLPGPLRTWLAASTRPVPVVAASAEDPARKKRDVGASAKRPAPGQAKQRVPQPKVHVANHSLPRQESRLDHPPGGVRGGLTLTRTPGEQVMVGDDVIVEVLYVKGERVRLRIEAPRSTQVSPAKIRARQKEQQPED
jgi:carbon storage regulator